MYLVTRDQFAAFLTGSTMDPEQSIQQEMSEFAASILADAPASVTHFLVTDHENGDDPEITFPHYVRDEPGCVQELIPLSNAPNGYYGLSRTRHYGSLDREDENRFVYQCYIGGSPLDSAPGFNITALVLFQAE